MQGMTVGIRNNYCCEVLDLMITTWHDKRESFTIKEVEELLGKLGRIAQAYQPLYHLMPQLYGLVAYALQENKHYMTSTSRQFCKMLE